MLCRLGGRPRRHRGGRGAGGRCRRPRLSFRARLVKVSPGLGIGRSRRRKNHQSGWLPPPRFRRYGSWDFYITADAWTEVAAGFNKKALAETLAKNDFLEVPEKGAHRAKMVRVPGIAKGMRLYHDSHRIFGDAAR